MFAGAAAFLRSDEDRIPAGVVLSGLGVAGMLASDAWPRTAHEELWVQRTADP
jgi:hypothetical protein